MSLFRLYVSVPVKSGTELWLDDERAHYLSRVRRVRVGDMLVIFNGHGGEYRCEVGVISRQGVQLLVGEHSPRDVESSLQIRLVQGVSRGDRMDVVVQKATELGVRRVSPVSSEFSVVRLDSKRSQKKIEHWERIAQSACEQCGRNILPVIDEPVGLASLIANGHDGIGVVLLPGGQRPLTDLPEIDNALTLLIGPEGGLSDTEVAMAVDRGFLARSMGPRILRTETAAIAALAVLQSRFGDLRTGAA